MLLWAALFCALGKGQDLAGDLAFAVGTVARNHFNLLAIVIAGIKVHMAINIGGILL